MYNLLKSLTAKMLDSLHITLLSDVDSSGLVAGGGKSIGGPDRIPDADAIEKDTLSPPPDNDTYQRSQGVSDYPSVQEGGVLFSDGYIVRFAYYLVNCENG